MSGAISPERLLRWLTASPEQQAAMERVLDGEPAAAPMPAPKPPEDLLTKKELARRLKLTVRTVENWQRRGVLPYLKVRRVVLFHWPDVMERLKANHGICRRRPLNDRSLSPAPTLPAPEEQLNGGETTNER